MPTTAINVKVDFRLSKICTVFAHGTTGQHPEFHRAMIESVLDLSLGPPGIPSGPVPMLRWEVYGQEGLAGAMGEFVSC